MGRPRSLPRSRADGTTPCRHLAKRYVDPSSSVHSGDSLNHEFATNLAGTALIGASEDGLPEDSVALAFQLRAIPKSALQTKIRNLTADEISELELATDEALGRIEPAEETD